MWIGGWWRADTLRSPDIDVDYASDRRQEIKRISRTAVQCRGRPAGILCRHVLVIVKAVLKDVARVHRLPHSLVNYITAIFDDNMDWTGLFKAGGCEQEGEPVRAGLPAGDRGYPHADGQPRAASIHASAIIVTPDNQDGRPASASIFYRSARWTACWSRSSTGTVWTRSAF